MDIHEMIGAATTSIRAMQITLETTERNLARAEADNARLRTDLANEAARRTEAQADLIHFQTVFEANVCLEAMKICKKMFTLTHDSMLAEASEAVKRMVEEKQAKETEERTAKTVDDIETERERIADEGYVPEAPAPVVDQLPEEGTVVQPPVVANPASLKNFYISSHLRKIPPDWRERPSFVFREGRWERIAGGMHMSESLRGYLNSPKAELRNSVARTVLGAFGI